MMTVVKNCAERKKHKREEEEEEEEGEEWKKKRTLVYNVPRPQNVQRGLDVDDDVDVESKLEVV